MSGSDDDVVGAAIGIVASLCIIYALFFSVIILVPVGIVIFVSWMVYKYYFHSPAALEKKSRQLTLLLYEEAKKMSAAPDEDEFGRLLFDQLQVPDPFLRPLIGVALELYDLEGFAGEIPEPPALCHSIEGARYRDYLSSLSAKSNAGAVKQMTDILVECFGLFLRYVPPSTDQSIYNATFSTFCSKPGDAVSDLVAHLFDDNHFGLFKSVKETLIRNQHEVSGVPMVGGNTDKLINPSDYEGDNVVFAYLKDTPFLELFDVPVPVEIPNKLRFEHSWCIGPPGTGKTQLIQYLISHDLPRVERGEASVVVIDSQGDLIDNIGGLGLFGPGEPLYGKLIVIRPDLEHPPALNLFDMGRDRHETYDEKIREKLTIDVIEQLTSVLDAILGDTATLTAKQETLYRFIIRLLMVLPSATLDTFTELLTTKTLDPYQEHIDQLPKPAREFYRDQFLGKEFTATKDQLAWRLSKLRENTFFDVMFSHPKSRLDLFTELNESKVILIHTDLETLKPEATNVFGRYFIGALLSASQERASLAFKNRLPVYAYIDECQDYIAHEGKIAKLLDQARKMNIGMFLAHQRSNQIENKNVLDALANAAIKFASTDNPNDLPLLSKAMRTTPDFIATQPKQHFAVSARREVDAFSFKVPFFVVEKMDKMEPADKQQIRNEMREKYCSPSEKKYAAPDDVATKVAEEPDTDASEWD